MRPQITLWIFVALVLGQMLAEYVAMLRTGTLRRKHQREWTYLAVAIPYKAMIAAALVECLGRSTRPSLTMVCAGALLSLAGIAIRVRGHFDLAGAFSAYVETSENHQLIRSGMYARVRHPMYVGSILLFVGLPLVLGAKVAWIFSALGIVGALIRIPREEAFLQRIFPEYRDYMQHTWRLFPYIY